MNNYITKSIKYPTNSEFMRESNVNSTDLNEFRKLNSCNSCFSFQNLLKAYYQCRKRKRKTINAAKFEISFEKELLKLEWELHNHIWQPLPSTTFVVTEPKIREIFAADFRDRIVHHLLYNYLVPIWEPKFIHGSYACRKNKGIHQSLKDLRKHIRQVTQNNRQQAYFLHLDIRGFFMSLKKEILFKLISSHIKNPELLWLTETIISNNPTENFTSKSDKSLFAKIPPHKSLFHIPEGQGLPIGNLTSQFFANVYLNELDQFAKHKLKAKYYLRYVDDFMLLSRDKNQLKKWRNEIISFLNKHLQLELNFQKQIFQTTDKGIDWLGYIIKPDCVLVRRQIVRTLKRKLFFFNQTLQNYPNRTTAQGQLLLPFFENYPPSELIEKILATINSYYGYFKHANTFRLRKHLWEDHFYKLKNYLEPKDSNFTSFQIKSDFLERSAFIYQKL